MKKYNVLSLYVIEYRGIKYICEKNYNKYKEVLTKSVFDEKDEIKIEKLTEYYSILSIMNFGTMEPLLLSKKDILNKYIFINLPKEYDQDIEENYVDEGKEKYVESDFNTNSSSQLNVLGKRKNSN